MIMTEATISIEISFFYLPIFWNELRGSISRSIFDFSKIYFAQVYRSYRQWLLKNTLGSNENNDLISKNDRSLNLLEHKICIIEIIVLRLNTPDSKKVEAVSAFV